MKPLKNYFPIVVLVLLLVFAGSLQDSQDSGSITHPMYDTLIAGTDSLVVDTLNGNWGKVIVTVTDTGSTFTDSIFFESYSIQQGEWVRMGATDLLTGSITTVGANAGTSRMYEMLDKAIFYIRYRRGNLVYTAGAQTLISLKATKN